MDQQRRLLLAGVDHTEQSQMDCPPWAEHEDSTVAVVPALKLGQQGVGAHTGRRNDLLLENFAVSENTQNHFAETEISGWEDIFAVAVARDVLLLGLPVTDGPKKDRP